MRMIGMQMPSYRRVSATITAFIPALRRAAQSTLTWSAAACPNSCPFSRPSGTGRRPGFGSGNTEGDSSSLSGPTILYCSENRAAQSHLLHVQVGYLATSGMGTVNGALAVAHRPYSAGKGRVHGLPVLWGSVPQGTNPRWSTYISIMQRNHMEVEPRMKTAIIAIAIIAAVGLLAMACGGKPTPVDDSQPTPAPTSTPVPPTPTPMSTPTVHRVEFRLGESVELPGQGIGISFDQVLEDSRCPANVVCVSAGKAVIELTVTTADTSAVVRPFLEPGTGIESPWVRVTSSQPGSEDISIRLTSLWGYPGSDGNEEGGGPTAVLEVMVDRG